MLTLFSHNFITHSGTNWRKTATFVHYWRPFLHTGMTILYYDRKWFTQMSTDLDKIWQESVVARNTFVDSIWPQPVHGQLRRTVNTKNLHNFSYVQWISMVSMANHKFLSSILSNVEKLFTEVKGTITYQIPPKYIAWKRMRHGHLEMTFVNTAR